MYRFNIAAGPMSRDIVEAVFQFSHERRKQVALIASKNQIDYDSGYVENWSTYRFMEFVRALRTVYDKADVIICRDHCGPGFNNIYDLNDVYETIQVDVEQGFDLIHIDFCKLDSSHVVRIAESIRAIEYAQKINPEIQFEIGTDEITGEQPTLERLDDDIRQFKAVCDPVFYVINTGSHTLENRQVGTFNIDFVQQASDLIHRYGMRVKEHNADFLTPDEIALRRGLVDAVNIAPELGVTQTRLSLQLAEQYGVPFGDWCERVWRSEKWCKWLLPGTDPKKNRMLCIEAAGHYNFTQRKYELLREDLLQMGKIDKNRFVAAARDVLNRYQQVFDTVQ